MVPSCHTLKRLRDKRRLIASVLILAYAVLLVQPCATAMEHEPAQHPVTCHEQPADNTAVDCLNQPVAECSTGDWSFDSRDGSILKFDKLLAVSAPVPTIASTATATGIAHHLSRAPPGTGAPAVYLLNCVFLK